MFAYIRKFLYLCKSFRNMLGNYLESSYCEIPFPKSFPRVIPAMLVTH